MPPRCRADMTCVNCGRKGHAASECREGRKEKSERPCFTCNKPGHLAREKPVDAEGYSLVTKGPKSQPSHLGDLIRQSAGHQVSQGSTNR